MRKWILKGVIPSIVIGMLSIIGCDDDDDNDGGDGDNGSNSVADLCDEDCDQYENCYKADFEQEYESMAACKTECTEEYEPLYEEWGAPCAELDEKLWTCIVGLSCSKRELFDDSEPFEDDYPCDDEDEAFTEECDSD
jgi:hypothetical protein